MQIPLRKGYFEASSSKLGLDGPKIKRLCTTRRSHESPFHPYDPFKIQTAVTKTDQPDIRDATALVDGPLHADRSDDSSFPHLFLVASIRHTEGHMDAPHRFVQGPVGDAAIDKPRVGHDDVYRIIGGDPTLLAQDAPTLAKSASDSGCAIYGNV